MNKKPKRIWTVMLAIGVPIAAFVGVLIICISMLGTINRRMNESATSNLLNTTRVIRESMEELLQNDLNSLNIIGNLRMNVDTLEKEKISMFCETMGFDWICVLDSEGNGMDYFDGLVTADNFPFKDEWTAQTTGYSNSYIGSSGRQQIAFWVPMFLDGEYTGTVFGGVVLSKYYSANVFTFYDGDGRTYLFESASGEWLLKSLGTDGTSKLQSNIYSLLSESNNSDEDVDAFRTAINERKAGTAELNFNGEPSYLCFLPVTSSQNWYITTVIAQSVLLKESSDVQSMITLAIAMTGVMLCIVMVGFAVLWMRKTKAAEIRYRDSLFANISANLDSAFIIYESDVKKAYVSDNVKRLFGLNSDWLKEDLGRLFDWCNIPLGDEKRSSFLDGTLSKPISVEADVADVLGEITRKVRLELIPADNGQKLAVLTDITKDKEMQNSLIDAMRRAESASHAKNEFLSAMSHDLRTPINGIVGMTMIAAANTDNKHRLLDCLAKISESSASLLSIINEILDTTQIESGKIELASESFNVSELLQQVLSINYPGIQQKNHTVDVRIRMMEHEEVVGDPTRLTRIATNLISNAIKYTPSGGTITLTLCEKPPMIQGYGCYELAVSDNGIGMSEDFQKKLFEPFEREDDVKFSRIQGTGLGMSIVKNIVEMMMGSIEVESEKGKGSTFRVIVNLQLAEQEKADERLKGLSALVVDGSPESSEIIAEILRDGEMNVETTACGDDAVKIIAERHKTGDDYTVALLDMHNSEADAFDLAGRIRTEVGENLPIIILVADHLSEITAETKDSGANGFITKPLYKTKLLRKMSEMIFGQAENSEMPTVPTAVVPQGKKILLAEDNEINREIAVEILSMMGVECDCANDGAAAVEIFSGSAEGAYDLILMDIQMPKMNGYDATRAIRALQRADAATIPIVAMTADAFKKDEQLACEAGMNDHLAKPISVTRLTQILVHYLGGQRGNLA